jgi:hypothetical protein
VPTAGEFGREGQALLLHIGFNDILEARLEDRHFATIQGIDAAGILVDTGDDMAEIRETGSRNEAHISGADHGDAHAKGPCFDQPVGPRPLTPRRTAHERIAPVDTQGRREQV